MPAKSDSPTVVGIVDEDNGTVSVAVEHGGQQLIVASKSLDGARAAAADPDNGDGDDAGKGSGS